MNVEKMWLKRYKLGSVKENCWSQCDHPFSDYIPKALAEGISSATDRSESISKMLSNFLFISANSIFKESNSFVTSGTDTGVTDATDFSFEKMFATGSSAIDSLILLSISLLFVAHDIVFFNVDMELELELELELVLELEGEYILLGNVIMSLVILFESIFSPIWI